MLQTAAPPTARQWLGHLFTPRARPIATLALCGAAVSCLGGCNPSAGPPSRPAIAHPGAAIRVAAAGAGFVDNKSGRSFVPWGFNYDQRVEDWWSNAGSAGWPRLVAAFGAMKAMHANTVRVLLEFDAFVGAPSSGWPHGTPNQASLTRLSALLALAGSNGLYLDITGLGMEEAWDSSRCAAGPRPAWCWYDELTTDSERWAAQAAFWTAVSHAVAASPASGVVAWFDLMNEPVVPSSEARTWCAATLGGYCYGQYLTRNAPASTAAVTAAWTKQMVSAVRGGGSDALISTGLVMAWPDRSTPNTCNGIRSSWGPAIAASLDFVSIHVYPSSPPDPWTQSANNCLTPGKPLVIEETTTLNTTELPEQDFILGTRRGGIAPYAAGMAYVDGQLVSQSGYVYRAVEPVTTPPSGRAASTASWVYMYGLYERGHTYLAADLVLDAGRLYTAERATSAAPPKGNASSSADWRYSGNGPSVSGWLGFYSDVSVNPIADALFRQFYSLFVRLAPLME